MNQDVTSINERVKEASAFVYRLREEIGLNYLMCAPLSRQSFRLLAYEVVPRL